MTLCTTIIICYACNVFIVQIHYTCFEGFQALPFEFIACGGGELGSRLCHHVPFLYQYVTRWLLFTREADWPAVQTTTISSGVSSMMSRLEMGRSAVPPSCPPMDSRSLCHFSWSSAGTSCNIMIVNVVPLQLLWTVASNFWQGLSHGKQ